MTATIKKWWCYGHYLKNFQTQYKVSCTGRVRPGIRQKRYAEKVCILPKPPNTVVPTSKQHSPVQWCLLFSSIKFCLKIELKGIAGIIEQGGETWHWPIALSELHPLLCPWVLSNLFLSLLWFPVSLLFNSTSFHYHFQSYSLSILFISHCQNS